MLPVTKFICSECGEVKLLSEAKAVYEEGESVYMCSDCHQRYAETT